MNYYEHHIGDYDEATAHLTACEDGMYSRMIRKYYATEKPLISDIPKLQRLLRAKTREEKSAVLSVLEEFFHLEDDGWHQDRCDSAIEKFVANEPEREIKKANEDNRTKRHREERASLFKRLTDAGHHAAWNIGIAELRALVGRVCDTPVTPNSNGPVTQPVTAPATPVTATQYPITRHQSPDTNHQYPIQDQKQQQQQHQPLSDSGQKPVVSPPKPKKTKTEKPEPETGPVWAAYANAYIDRYHVPPVRNSMVNGQLVALVKRIGIDDSAHVAAFYVGHKHRFYVEKMHPVGLLLSDCEKLRTEWATSTQMTATRAQQQDRTQTNLDAFGPLIAEAEAREQAERETQHASE